MSLFIAAFPDISMNRLGLCWRNKSELIDRIRLGSCAVILQQSIEPCERDEGHGGGNPPAIYWTRTTGN